MEAINDVIHLCEDIGERALQLLQVELEKKRSIADIAREMEYSRTAVSLVLKNKYVGDPYRVYERVIDVFDQVMCPFLDRNIARADCVGYSQRSAPTQNPTGMRHWRSCQACAKNKEKKYG